MSNQSSRNEKLRNKNLNKDSVERLDYRKQQREEQYKRAELQRKKLEIDTLIKKLEKAKYRLQEIHYLLRRIQTEESRAKNILDKEYQDDKNVKRDLTEKQNELEKEKTENDKLLADIESKISKEKEIIKEHERVLTELEKKSDDVERQKDRKSRYLTDVISRLIRIFDREKIETERTQQNHKKLLERQRVLQGEMTNTKTEITILSNKLMALKRNLDNYN